MVGAVAINAIINIAVIDIVVAIPVVVSIDIKSFCMMLLALLPLMPSSILL